MDCYKQRREDVVVKGFRIYECSLSRDSPKGWDARARGPVPHCRGPSAECDCEAARPILIVESGVESRMRF